MKTLTAIAVVLGLALAGGPAFAQQATTDPHHPGGTQPPAAAKPTQPGPGMGMMGGGMMGGQGMMGGMPMMQGGMMGHMGGMMMGGEGGQMMGPGKHVEGRLAFLRAEIKITDAQNAPWKTFADAVRAANKSMAGAMPMQARRANLPKSTWLDRMDQDEQAAATRLAAIKSVRAAAEPLYAALNDEQKKIADELMAGPMGPMGQMGPMAGRTGPSMGRM